MTIAPAIRNSDAGTSLPGYEILDVVEKRDSVVLLRARQLSLNRVVSIRMLRRKAVSESAAQGLKREASLLARFQHPHIVAIVDRFQHEGRECVVLNHGGNTLASKILGKAQPTCLAVSLVERLARTVAYIHQRGILHCNLKPRKVFLAAAPTVESPNPSESVDCEEVYGVPLLGGFELALHVKQLSELTIGDIRGTPSYMAPEQARGFHPEVGPRTDLYGVGAILYELLTGRPPFQAATAPAVLRQVIETDPEPVRSFNRGVDRMLEAICLRCLHKDPERRYATGLELAGALRDYRAERAKKRWF